MTYYRTVRLSDTDAAGVVYFARLLSICHEAYEASLAENGIELKAFFRDPATAIPIVHGSADFFRPLFCGDRLAVEMAPQRLNEGEFEVVYEIFGTPASPPCLARAKTRHACIDPASRRRVPLPDPILRWLSRG